MVTCVDTIIPDIEVTCGFASTDPGRNIRRLVIFSNTSGGWPREFSSTDEFRTFVQGIALGYEMAGLPLPKDFGEEALKKTRHFESGADFQQLPELSHRA